MLYVRTKYEVSQRRSAGRGLNVKGHAGQGSDVERSIISQTITALSASQLI